VFRLSKSGKAVEILLNELPNSVFDYYFYVPLSQAKEIVEGKKTSTNVSLLVADH